MLVELDHAAQILTSTTDEVMFMVQSGDLQSHIDDDTMTWKFEINDVLELKAKLDLAKKMIAGEPVDDSVNNTAFVDGD